MHNIVLITVRTPEKATKNTFATIVMSWEPPTMAWQLLSIALKKHRANLSDHIAMYGNLASA